MFDMVDVFPYREPRTQHGISQQRAQSRNVSFGVYIGDISDLVNIICIMDVLVLSIGLFPSVQRSLYTPNLDVLLNRATNIVRTG